MSKPKRKRLPAKKRKQGGQNGHKRHFRELIPSEQCTAVTPCHPNACRRCGGELQPDGATPRRHQVWDLPPIEPVVIEYQLFRGHCPCCGITTSASLPPGVPTGQCGPRLAASTGLLMGHLRQSIRRASMFLGDLLNIPCSPSWTVKIQTLVSQAIAAPYEQIRGELEMQSQLLVDESPTTAWLWVAVAPMFAVFGNFGNRSRESLVSLIGDYSGIILNCDRANQQHGRTHASPGSDLSQAAFWDTEFKGKPIPRTDLDDRGNVSPAKPQRLSILDQRRSLDASVRRGA